ADDATVPLENSVLYQQALRAAGVPAELRVYDHGPHGIGLRTEHEAARRWPAACAAWLAGLNLLPTQARSGWDSASSAPSCTRRPVRVCRANQAAMATAAAPHSVR